VLAQAPSAHVARAAAVAEHGAALAELAAPSAPATAPPAAANAAVDPIATAVVAAPEARPAKKALPSNQMRAALGERSPALSDPASQASMQHAKPADTSKTRRPVARPAVQVKQQQGRKRMDQEFGF
jgi:hypothetical protein